MTSCFKLQKQANFLYFNINTYYLLTFPFFISYKYICLKSTCLLVSLGSVPCFSRLFLCFLCGSQRSEKSLTQLTGSNEKKKKILGRQFVSLLCSPQSSNKRLYNFQSSTFLKHSMLFILPLPQSRNNFKWQSEWDTSSHRPHKTRRNKTDRLAYVYLNLVTTMNHCPL